MAKLLQMGLFMPRDEAAGDRLSGRLGKLAGSSRSWIEAEAKLAKAEVSAETLRIAKIAVLAVIIAASLFSVVILGSIFLVVFLAPYIGGLAVAAGVLALVMAAVAIISLALARQLLRRESHIVAMIKRLWNLAAGQGNMSHENS